MLKVPNLQIVSEIIVIGENYIHTCVRECRYLDSRLYKNIFCPINAVYLGALAIWPLVL